MATERGAIIDGPYRYLLTRLIPGEDETKRVVWVMLNPSTADASRDDPTIRRVLGFSRRWGYGAVSVVNLFAFRATDPSELVKIADPVGPRNHAVMSNEIAHAWSTVVAWGARGGTARQRYRFNGKYYCLGVTKGGEPRHPLYVRADTARVLWKGEGS